MWIFSKWGFMSVVKKPNDALLTVRSRAKADLVNIRQRYMPALGEIRHTKDTDYPYRARISREEFSTGMARIALDIDYPNFKSEVARVRGMDIEKIYAKVWAVMAANEHILDGPARKVQGKAKGGGRQRTGQSD